MYIAAASNTILEHLVPDFCPPRLSWGPAARLQDRQLAGKRNARLKYINIANSCTIKRLQHPPQHSFAPREVQGLRELSFCVRCAFLPRISLLRSFYICTCSDGRASVAGSWFRLL